MGGEMSIRPLVRPHHLLQFDGFHRPWPEPNGHQFLLPYPTLEESLSITTLRCDLAIATHARKMHK